MNSKRLIYLTIALVAVYWLWKAQQYGGVGPWLQSISNGTSQTSLGDGGGDS